MHDRTAQALIHASLTELDRNPEWLAAAKRCRNLHCGTLWLADRMRDRGHVVPPFDARRFVRLGLIKYGLCLLAMIGFTALAWAVRLPWLAISSPLVFYAIEAQLVFLFPAALVGARRPFRAARRLTVRAGGTLRVMRTVMPIAAFMLFGGLSGGVVRAWAGGCLAVVLWWERLPNVDVEWFDPFDAFGLARLRIRTEVIPATTQADVLLVSDLHLGRPWNRRLPRDVLRLARRHRPTLILLAGDLVDRPRGMAELGRLLRRLVAIAPVVAMPGNHDRDPAAQRDAIRKARAHWLPDGPLALAGMSIVRPGDSALDDRVAVQCTHRPADFDTADPSIRLFLAGHLHGGQCVLWRWRGRLLPAWFVDRWHVDRIDRRGQSFVICRGAGDTLPLRFNCPREVVLCRLTHDVSTSSRHSS